MDIGKVLEKAFKYPWKNRALWFYGVLIAIFSFGSSGSNYTAEDGDITQIQSYLNTLNIDWTFFWIAIGVIGLIGLIIGILSIIISAWSEAAIIGGVRDVELNKKITRRGIGKTGKRTVWNLIVLTLLLPLGIVVATIALAVPIIAVIVALPDPVNITVGVVVGLTSIVILVPTLVYFGIVWSLAPCAVVLEKMKAVESIKLTMKRVKGNFWLTFLLLFIIFAITGMAMFLSIIPLFIFGGLVIYFWSNAIVASVIFGIISIAYLVFLAIVAGYFQAVVRTGKTVWWLELNKTKGKNGKQ
jgi:hypothetical protein